MQSCLCYRVEFNILDSTSSALADIYSFTTEKVLLHMKVREGVPNTEFNQFGVAGWTGAAFAAFTVMDDNTYTIEYE